MLAATPSFQKRLLAGEYECFLARAASARIPSSGIPTPTAARIAALPEIMMVMTHIPASPLA
jgi:hypothetical protein